MKKEGRNTSVKKSGRKSILIISATIFLALVGMISFFYIYFGKIYGLQIYSEPDEGTTIRIHIPILKYSEELNKEVKRE